MCHVDQERQLACQCGRPRWDALKGLPPAVPRTRTQLSILFPTFPSFAYVPSLLAPIASRVRLRADAYGNILLLLLRFLHGPLWVVGAYDYQQGLTQNGKHPAIQKQMN